MPKKEPLYPHVPKSRGNNTSPPPPPTLPTKAEMDELDVLLDKATGIAMRWWLRITPAEQAEYPTLYAHIKRLQGEFSGVADAMVGISEEMGFGPFRGDWPNRSNGPLRQT